MKRIPKNVLFVALFIFIALIVMNNIYKKIGYGYFKKALSRPGVTFFTRDNKVRYSKMNSYKIENKDYNNATFYKKIKLNKNTPYKITCVVKTENVEILNEEHKNSGAKISILESEEQSASVTGTTDWQRITLYFNSNQREEISVGFMLGGDTNTGNVKGTAWFSDLQIEEGHPDENNNWNFICFIFKNTNANILNTTYKYFMDENEISNVKNCMERFKNTCSALSNNQMQVNYDIVEIDTPITNLSYDNNNGYYIDAENVFSVLEPYLQLKNYDHIFLCARLNDSKSSIPVKNWIGLGGMEYNGIGYSNIRMPTNKNSTEYVYNEVSNRFPEEVFVHEFLHTLEKNSKKYGFEVPELHNNQEYKYYKEKGQSLYNWYKAYMTSSIGPNNIGLNEKIYNLKPLDESNFSNSKKLNEFEDVKNIIERLKLVLNVMRGGANNC